MKNKIRKVLFLISAVVFVVSLGILVYVLVIEPSINKRTNDEIRSIYYETKSEPEQEQEQDSSPVPNKFGDLLAINKDIKGWIKIDNTVIDYPVLQSGEDDPEYYLYRNYKKEQTKYGSIFIESSIQDLVNAKNIVIHGHNMNDGSMFAAIRKYTVLDFYKSTPVFTFDTVDENAKWKVVSVFRSNTLREHGPIFNYTKTVFNSSEEFMEFAKDIKDRSIINIPVDIDKDDTLVTLSTCSYEFKEFRTVVVARKIRENEDENVDVDKADKNPNPVLPECYNR